MRKYILAALAAATLTGTATARTTEAVSETVSFADLDLTTVEGAAALEWRISKAATRVCTRGSLRSVPSGTAFAKCRKGAIAGAMEQVASIESANQTLFAGR